MLTAKRDKSVTYEQQAKFIQERILFTEKNFGEVCNVFAEYTRKAGRLRDKSDEVAKIVMNYAEFENVNKTLRTGLANFAYCFSTLGDYGDLRIQKLENKVIPDLSQYETICKNAKEEVKHIFNVRDREIARRRQLDRIRERNPRNRQQITQAETELLKATAEVSRTIHGLEEQTNDFEKRKLHDIKEIMLQFITIEMAYHAKALEVLSKAYQDVDEIDNESDLQVISFSGRINNTIIRNKNVQDFQNIRGSLDTDFRKAIRTPDSIPHLSNKRYNFKSAQSLGSLNTLQSTPTKKQSMKRRGSTGHISKSNETLDSVNVASVESIDSETENSTVSEVTNQFLARKHRHQRK